MNLKQTGSDDRRAVESLISGAHRSHVHLDWIDPSNLTHLEPFLLASDKERPIGVLGCPPDIPSVAWLRAFAAADEYDLREIWRDLWAEAASRLREKGVERVAALALEDWFGDLTLEAGFDQTNSVIFYELDLDLGTSVMRQIPYRLRSIRSTDSKEILGLDQHAFDPIWQLSEDALSVALIQASSASLIEDQGKVLGYQITTSSPFGAHLARLAVQPSIQRGGLGTALVNDAVTSVKEIGLGNLSVNTQEDNTPSRQLYEKLGFRGTGKKFPVFEIQL